MKNRTWSFCVRQRILLFCAFCILGGVGLSLGLSLALAQNGIITGANDLDVPLTVKENAGVGATGYPVSVVVPLPRGDYSTTAELGIAGLPSQVEALERWPQDGSLRHVLVHFQPSVAADGSTVYNLTSGGQTGPANPVTLNETRDEITVSTGPLQFTVDKNAFNLLDQVWLDQNTNGSFEDGERIILSSSQNGGVFVPRPGAGGTQYDTSRTDLTVVVEEAGPLRAVIRVEAPARFVTTTQHIHGFAARLYAYAGLPVIKVDYQLQNSDKTMVRSWPLYFEEHGLDFALNLTANPTLRFGLGDGTVFQTTNTTGATLAQELHNNFKIYTPGLAYDSGTLPNNAGPDGFIDVSDANAGVTAMIRNFWQSWPNGLAVDDQNKLTLQLFPPWSAQWHDGQLSPSGLYWLEDMQHVYKETLLFFHGPGISDSSLINLARTFQYQPTAVVPTDWHRQTRATLDLGGVLPTDDAIPAFPDQRQPIYPSIWYSQTHVYYGFNWSIFGDPEPGYRDRSCTTGGWPYFNAAYVAGGSPGDFFKAEAQGMGELNVRPEWMTGYDHEADWPTLQLTDNPYCGGRWRLFTGHGDPVLAAPPLPGTGGTAPVYYSRDDPHGWFYHVANAYFYTGNPWIKDWYEFIAEFRQTRLQRLDPFPDTSSRAMGHALNHVIQAYRITGDPALLTGFEDHVRTYLRPDQDPFYGDQLESVEASGGGFQTGYLMRTMVDYLEEVRGQDWQAYAEGFNYLSGLMEWNYHYGNFPYFFNARNGGAGSSSGTGLTLIDPQAWYYWHTGKQKYLDHIEAYRTTGINGGEQPYGNFSNWGGGFEGRYYLYVQGMTRSDTTPPPAIADLDAALINGSSLYLTWTAPADAVRYHIVYSDKPIVEANSLDPGQTNWWAAEVVGPDLVPIPGLTQNISIAPVSNPTYAAIFTFDAQDNMSEMSNVALAIPENWESDYLPFVER